MNQQEIMLAAIGDLEVTRRALIMEIQARDARIAELEEQLGIPSSNGNGLVVPDKEIVLP
jgi:hypothetical protein